MGMNNKITWVIMGVIALMIWGSKSANSVEQPKTP